MNSGRVRIEDFNFATILEFAHQTLAMRVVVVAVKQLGLDSVSRWPFLTSHWARLLLNRPIDQDISRTVASQP